MKVQTLKHTDVRKKELLYVILTTNTGKEYLMNIGTKSFEKITELIEEEEKQKTEGEEEPKKPKK